MRSETDAGDAAGWADGVRLLRVAASCPRCGTRPALRVAEPVVRAADGRAPQERLATYQCQRKHCGMIFDLTAGAFQHAS